MYNRHYPGREDHREVNPNGFLEDDTGNLSICCLGTRTWSMMRCVRIMDMICMKDILCLKEKNHIRRLVDFTNSWIIITVRTRILSRQGPHACALIAWLGSVYLPRGRVTDTREKELPLRVYVPKVEGR
ncbi:hypothetical protein CRG98_016831 [Punica granatum]|uniref:Uncharacterized protein n=1 Tax=Punica granatum TaxID=22663 RepID=A0A2I0K2L0_PUNGR|nr:hypothetical protein CRG98_016831 [Punica granatum]